MLDTRRDTMDAEIRKTTRVKIMAKEQTGSDLGEARSDTVRDKRAEKRWPGARMMPERNMERIAGREEHAGLHLNTHTRYERRTTRDERREKCAATSEQRNATTTRDAQR